MFAGRLLFFHEDMQPPRTGAGVAKRPQSRSMKTMTQEILNEAIAEATGEDVRTIDWLGFVPLTSGPVEFETEETRPPLMVDWDELELERYLAMCG